MGIHRVIRRRIRRQGDGINFVGDVSAVISANMGTGSSRSHVFTQSTQRIVQRAGRKHASEETKQGGTTAMQPEELQKEPEATTPPGSTEDEREREHATPPIDEDVAGSVNAAVPDTDE